MFFLCSKLSRYLLNTQLKQYTSRFTQLFQLRKLSYYYNICDIFCMPSYFEAYGLVFGEALVYGLPCIGRNNFAMKEFIQDGYNGYLIEKDDPYELAKKMFDLLNDDKIKSNVENNRGYYIEEYSWDTVAERIIKVINTDQKD